MVSYRGNHLAETGRVSRQVEDHYRNRLKR